MAKKYEVNIEIIDENYIDKLIISLVRQGYSVYYIKEDKKIYFEIYDDDLQEIKE